jgi:hypothetical protein
MTQSSTSPSLVTPSPAAAPTLTREFLEQSRGPDPSSAPRGSAGKAGGEQRGRVDGAGLHGIPGNAVAAVHVDKAVRRRSRSEDGPAHALLSRDLQLQAPHRRAPPSRVLPGGAGSRHGLRVGEQRPRVRAQDDARQAGTVRGAHRRGARLRILREQDRRHRHETPRASNCVPNAIGRPTFICEGPDHKIRGNFEHTCRTGRS